jgi:hypothetical protein
VDNPKVSLFVQKLLEVLLNQQLEREFAIDTLSPKSVPDKGPREQAIGEQQNTT